MHVFKYSRRKGTAADTMKDQVDEKIKTVRSNILMELANKMSTEYRQMHLNKEVDVLIEEEIEVSGEKYFSGHTMDYIKVLIPTNEKMNINEICSVKLVESLLDGSMKAE